MNPLLQLNLIEHNFDFSKITTAHFKEALETLVPKVKEEHEYIADYASLTYKELYENQPHTERIGLINNLLSHLTNVVNTDELQEVSDMYQQTLPEIFMEMSLDERIYYKLCAYTNTEEFSKLDELRQEMIWDNIEYLTESGINLPEEKKNALTKIAVDISMLNSDFANNIMEAQANSSILFSKEDLPSLPERCYKILEQMENVSEDSTPLYNVDYASGLYSDIQSYCSNVESRKKCYEEGLKIGVTGENDNVPVLRKLTKLMHENAKILNYKSFAHMNMKKNMAKNPEQAISFINSIAEKCLPIAKQQQLEIIRYGEKLLERPVELYDFAYVLHKMGETVFDLKPELVRQYFTVDSLMNGFFDIFQNLYKINFTQISGETLWHQDVLVYEVSNSQGNKIGKIYFDLYMRAQKQQGAWMSNAVSRELDIEGNLTLPVVYVVCNAPKNGTDTPTFSFSEVETFFHEMGHALHHLLTTVNCEYFSGLNNVQMDAIELPSQFMENFCFDYEIIKKLTKNVNTGEVLPKDIFDKILHAKNFNSAIMWVRQSILSKIDLEIFSNPEEDPISIEKRISNEWMIHPQFISSKLITPTFSHIFAGGYSAGYYSYAWAEVLAADAFVALKEAGNTYLEQVEIANQFKEKILEVGGRDDMSYNFYQFRGRDPEIKHFLNSYGIPG